MRLCLYVPIRVFAYCMSQVLVWSAVEGAVGVVKSLVRVPPEPELVSS